MKKPIKMKLRIGSKSDSGLGVFVDKRGVKSQINSDTNSKMYTKELHRGDKYCLIIRGKVDGMSDGTIVETKNRTKYLFNELRDYERVQLECYMFLTGFNNALLTEHYNNESNCINYTHDEGFWITCVDKIIQFIDTHIATFI